MFATVVPAALATAALYFSCAAAPNSDVVYGNVAVRTTKKALSSGAVGPSRAGAGVVLATLGGDVTMDAGAVVGGAGVVVV